MLFFCFYGLLLINVVAFALYVLDKYMALHGRRRISERVLLMLALFGGSVGALMAMSLVRHKTQKRCFSIGVPLLLIMQLLIMIAVLLCSFFAI